MKKVFVVFAMVFVATPSFGQNTVSKEVYTFIKDDPNGIGKWYMGREIAHVMGFQGIGWLERPEREAEENTTRLLQNMEIGVNDAIADIGAGSGYHVFKMALQATQGINLCSGYSR